MALEVTVGPPVLTINTGHTFLVSELDGTITPASDQGLYSADTRCLSGYQLFINGKSWTLLIPARWPITPRKRTWSIPWSSPKRVSLLREPWAFS